MAVCCSMKTRLERLIYLVRLRVSQGAPIASGGLKALGLFDVADDVLDFTLRKHCFMYKPMPLPRQGWDEQFRAARVDTRDGLWLMQTATNAFDEGQWTW